MVAAQDTMTANFADGMPILVLGMWDLAEAACGLVAAGATLATALAAALASLGDGAGFPFYYGGHVVVTFWDRDSAFQAIVKKAFLAVTKIGTTRWSSRGLMGTRWFERTSDVDRHGVPGIAAETCDTSHCSPAHVARPPFAHHCNCSRLRGRVGLQSKFRAWPPVHNQSEKLKIPSSLNSYTPLRTRRQNPSPEPVARDGDGYHPFRETTAVAFTAQYTDFAGRLCSVSGTVLFHYRCEVLRTTKIC